MFYNVHRLGQVNQTERSLSMHVFPITFQDWMLSLSLSSTLGQQYDQNSHTISISGNIPQGWDWYLLVRVTDQNKYKYNVYLLTQEAQCLSLVLDATILVDSGNYELQLKGIQRSDPSVVRHTNVVNVTVNRTLNGDATWPNIPSEFTQIEGRVQAQAAQLAQQAGIVSSLASQVESLAAQVQEAANSTKEDVSMVQNAADEISQQADACNSALSKVESYATQTKEASRRAENADATAQTAATSALESQNAAESACAQAQSFLSDTLVARDEATKCVQDFQGTLGNIFTKQESNNQFARALLVNTESAINHEIHPEPNSNIVVTSHGYMMQKGTEVASPDNIKPITTGGQPLRPFILTGDEVWNTSSEGIHTYKSGISVEELPSLFCSHYHPCTSVVDVHQTPYSVTIDTDGTVAINDPRYGTSTDFQYHLRDCEVNGDSISLFIPSGNTSEPSDLYTPIVLDCGSEDFRCHFVKLHEPLCQDDHLITSQGGKCMEVHQSIVVTLSGNEHWIKDGKRFFCSSLGLDIKNISWNNGKVMSSHAIPGQSNYTPNCFEVWNKVLFLNLSRFADSDASTLSAYLSEQFTAGTPFTLVLQRSNPVTYIHPEIQLILPAGNNDTAIIKGEHLVSISYNQSLSYAINELRSALIR